MGNRMNAGYLITDSIHIGTTEFVLGVSITERPTFVTWACQGSDYYYWGHYHSNLLAAKKGPSGTGRGGTGVPDDKAGTLRRTAGEIGEGA